MAWATAGQASSFQNQPASVRFQLRGHLQELGERPTLRVFETNAAYDAFRTSLGDANVFPPASQLFMSFDTDRLALYSRGNDVGGRCLSRTAIPQDGVALTLALQWDAGTCGAPASAHYPFLLLSLSRAASDGSSWVPAGGRQLCATAGPDTDACTTVGAAASPAPTGVPSPSTSAAASPSPSAPALPNPVASAPPTASPTPTASPVPTPSRPPATTAPPTVAAASPTPAPRPADSGTNPFFIAIIVGFVLLVLIAIIRSRPPGLRRL
ncbi:MAG TPA: hypothetical protein VEP48_01110 [Methylomirabilota bacterium]|nr:hypothetical protein [Methylomirabilota bacterium]